MLTAGRESSPVLVTVTVLPKCHTAWTGQYLTSMIMVSHGNNHSDHDDHGEYHGHGVFAGHSNGPSQVPYCMDRSVFNLEEDDEEIQKGVASMNLGQSISFKPKCRFSHAMYCISIP